MDNEAQGDKHHLGQIAKDNTHHAGRHGAHDELTLSADVEDTGSECEGHGQTCHNIGDGINNNIGNALESGDAGEQLP